VDGKLLLGAFEDFQLCHYFLPCAVLKSCLINLEKEDKSFICVFQAGTLSLRPVRLGPCSGMPPCSVKPFASPKTSWKQTNPPSPPAFPTPPVPRPSPRDTLVSPPLSQPAARVQPRGARLCSGALPRGLPAGRAAIAARRVRLRGRWGTPGGRSWGAGAKRPCDNHLERSSSERYRKVA
jgi:hypothetical protein